MQNDLEGIHFTLRFSPSFQGKGAAVERGEGGGKRRRQEGREHEHTLSVFVH